MLSAFDYMMGSFDTEFEGGRVPVLGTLLVVLFVVFMIILMLNLLIALMGNTFSAVSEKGLAQWRQEQASIVLEERLVGGAFVPPCLYVLMGSTAFEEYEETRDATDGVHRSGGVHGSAGGGMGDSGGSGGNDAAGRDSPLDRVLKLEQRLDDLGDKLDLIVSKMKYA